MYVKITTRSFFILLLLFFIFPALQGITDLEWITNREEDLVFYYHPRDRQLMETLIPLILSDIDSFHRSIGFYPPIKGEIIIAPDKEYYQEIIAGFSGIIEFSEAIYNSANMKIYIRNPRDLKDFSSLRKIILHEYIHLFLDTQFFNIPLWFNEGMAVFFSAGLSFDRELLYARDYLLGNSLTLREMSRNYPDSRVRWDSFYVKSALAVKYLHTKQREEFYSLWEYKEEPDDFFNTFFRTFKMTTHQFSTLFEEHLKRRFRIEMLLAFSGIVWSLLPFILLLAWLRKRWLNQKIKKTWEAAPFNVEEDPSPPEKTEDLT